MTATMKIIVFLGCDNIQSDNFHIRTMHCGDSGSTVVKVLCYKSGGRWFDPSWCHWDFSLT